MSTCLLTAPMAASGLTSEEDLRLDLPEEEAPVFCAAEAPPAAAAAAAAPGASLDPVGGQELAATPSPGRMTTSQAPSSNRESGLKGERKRGLFVRRLTYPQTGTKLHRRRRAKPGGTEIK